MGIELRMRDPSAEGVAPLRLACAALSDGEEDEGFRAGVFCTSLRNCSLFIVMFGAVVLRVVGKFEITALRQKSGWGLSSLSSSDETGFTEHKSSAFLDFK
jgi:hypothetical protein